MTDKTPLPGAHVGNWNDLFGNDPDYSAPGASGPPMYVPAIEFAVVKAERDRLIFECQRLRAEKAELQQLLSEAENCVRKELLRPNEGDTVFLCRSWIDATRKAIANETEAEG